MFRILGTKRTYRSQGTSPTSQTTDRAGRERLLRDVVRPTVRKTLQAHLDHDGWSEESQEIEDLAAQTVAAVLVALDRGERGGHEIHNLAAYAKQTAEHHFDQYLRKKRPLYWSVRGSIAHICRNEGGGIAKWKAASEFVVGYVVWRLRNQVPKPAQVAFLREQLAREEQIQILVAVPPDASRRTMLRHLLDWARCPLPFGLTVQAVCAQCGPVSGESVVPLDGLDVPSTAACASEIVVRREQLRWLWAEILELPLRQRQALLLNFTDDSETNLIALLPFTGIATVGEIAQALEMETAALANVWPDLPLSDRSISKRLGCTTMQVSNLRAVARARLQRRMSKAEY